MATRSPDQYGPEETRQRLVKTLRGAFAGPPTPLKDIPKKHGESRGKGAGKHPKSKTKPKSAAFHKIAAGLRDALKIAKRGE